MRVSIVTAVHNGSATIGQTVASILGQTHRDIEHIVIDGQSSDETLAVLAARIDPKRTVIVSEPDCGIYDALNKGQSIATGEIVGILNSDDFYADDKVIADVAEAFRNQNIDAVYGDLDLVARSDTSRVVRRWRSGPYRYSKLAWGWVPPHQALFLRRSVIDRLGMFDLRYDIAADYDAMLRYFRIGRIVPAYIPRVLVKMRFGGASTGSIASICKSTREDYQVLRRSGAGGLLTLVCKKLRKLGQFRLR